MRRSVAHSIDLVRRPGGSLSLVDRRESVRVAIEGEPRAPALEHRGLSTSAGWVEPQPSLMLVPSGSANRTVTSAPRSAARRGDGRRGAFAVDDTQPSSRRPSVTPSIDAALVGQGDVREGSDVGTDLPTPSCRVPAVATAERRGDHRLDGVLLVVGQQARRGEMFDAVVGEGVVRRRDDHPTTTPSRSAANATAGWAPRQNHISALGAHPGGRGGPEQRTRRRVRGR